MQQLDSLMGANVIQHGLRAGLVDELIVPINPVLLNEGIGPFDNLGIGHTRLERTGVEVGPGGVAHLFYDVIG